MLLKLEKDSISQQELIQMAKQALAGMVYLEAHKIVHRDLALRNLLVKVEDGGYKIKIGEYESLVRFFLN